MYKGYFGVKFKLQICAILMGPLNPSKKDSYAQQRVEVLGKSAKKDFGGEKKKI